MAQVRGLIESGCPEEIRELFEFLGVEVEYEVSRFRAIRKPEEVREWQTKYWKRRAYDIVELNTTTMIRRE